MLIVCVLLSDLVCINSKIASSVGYSRIRILERDRIVFYAFDTLLAAIAPATAASVAATLWLICNR